MACALCGGSGLLWPGFCKNSCPLCDGVRGWPKSMPTELAVDGLASTCASITLQEIERLCAIGTSEASMENQDKALAACDERAQRARHAQETLAILVAGTYIVAGRYGNCEQSVTVDISASLCKAVASSKHLPAATWRAPTPKVGNQQLSIQVRCCTTLAAAQDLATSATRIAAPGVLSFASARRPGGGFRNGAGAQEESLARSSGIYPCLAIHFDSFYIPNRRTKSGLYTHDLIHSPGVPVLRDSAGALLVEPYLVDFVTAAAPNMKRRGAVGAAAKCSDVLHERIRRVLHTFASNGCVDLVLGAWGCGVFGNDPATVARLFREALSEFSCFRRVIFAVLDPSMAKTFGDEFQVLVGSLEGAATSQVTTPRELDESDVVADG